MGDRDDNRLTFVFLAGQLSKIPVWNSVEMSHTKKENWQHGRGGLDMNEDRYPIRADLDRILPLFQNTSSFLNRLFRCSKLFRTHRGSFLRRAGLQWCKS